MTADRSDSLLYCTFCGKSQHEVQKLIAGPEVYICDECVVLCEDIVGGESEGIFWDGGAAPSENLQKISQQLAKALNLPEPTTLLLSQLFYRRMIIQQAKENRESPEADPLHLLLRGPAIDRISFGEKLPRFCGKPVVARDASRLTASDKAPSLCERMVKLLLRQADYLVPMAQTGTFLIDDWEGILDDDPGRSQLLQSALLTILSGEVVRWPSEEDPDTDWKINTGGISTIIGGRFLCLEGLPHAPAPPDADPLALPGLSDAQARALEGAGLKAKLVGRLSGVIDLFG